MRYEQGKLLNLKHDYEKKGIEDGSRQVPHLEAELDHNESELVLKGGEEIRPLEKYHDKYIQDQKLNLDQFKNEWAESKTKNSFEKNVDDELLSLSNNLEAVYRDQQTLLVGTRTDVIVSNADLNKFRVENKLTRQAEYPISYMKAIAIMSSIVIGEALINAYAHQGEGGLLDGASVAFFISAINVIIGAALGFSFRFKNHIKSSLKALGWFSLIIFMISAVYMNSLYATFRTELHKILDEESLTVNTEEALTPEEIKENNEAKINPTKIAFVRALKMASKIFLGEVPFKDLMSYLTFFLTVIFSCIAFYEGYHLDDAYPGFGKKDRNNKKNKRIDDEEWKLFKQK